MSQGVKLTVAIVILAGAGFLTLRWLMMSEPHGEDLPEGTFWLCRNEGCGHEFNLPLKEVVRQRGPNGLVPCPKCKKSLTLRAAQCPHCKRVVEMVGHGMYPDKCPRCNERITEQDVRLSSSERG